MQVFDDEGGEAILVTNPAYGMGFQIFIQPWNEPGPFTEARIRRDLPDLVMENVIETELLHDARTAVLRFATRDAELGDLLEAWFVRDGYFYQLSFYVPDPEDAASWIRGFTVALAFAAP